MNIKAVKETFIRKQYKHLLFIYEKLLFLKATSIFMELNTQPKQSRVNPTYNKVSTNSL